MGHGQQNSVGLCVLFRTPVGQACMRPPRTSGGCEPVPDNLQVGGLPDDTANLKLFYSKSLTVQVVVVVASRRPTR